MKYVAFLLFSFIVFAADQLSKWGITEVFLRPRLKEPGPSLNFIEWLIHAPGRLPPARLEILSFFNLVMVWNKGITFGLFNKETDYGPLALTVFALAISVFFLIWLFKTQSRLQAFAIALVIGGALGNTMDRLRFGAVIDFLDFHVLGWHWPAFNMADSCIVVGIVLLIGYSFFFEKSSPAIKML